MTLPSILEAIRNSPPEDLAEVWAELARTAAGDSSPKLIADRTGRALGYFFAVETNPPPPPEDTPEQRAELLRRLATIDDDCSTEEMKEFIRRGSRASSPES
jgi:hypothetical protein